MYCRQTRAKKWDEEEKINMDIYATDIYDQEDNCTRKAIER